MFSADNDRMFCRHLRQESQFLGNKVLSNYLKDTPFTYEWCLHPLQIQVDRVQ